MKIVEVKGKKFVVGMNKKEREAFYKEREKQIIEKAREAGVSKEEILTSLLVSKLPYPQWVKYMDSKYGKGKW